MLLQSGLPVVVALVFLGTTIWFFLRSLDLRAQRDEARAQCDEAQARYDRLAGAAPFTEGRWPGWGKENKAA